MNRTNKTAIVGTTALALLMIIQLYGNYRLRENFNTYFKEDQSLVQQRLNESGFPKVQADLIFESQNRRIWMINSSVFSNVDSQISMTTVSCILVLLLSLYKVKRSKED